jgi:hypothetical protein
MTAMSRAEAQRDAQLLKRIVDGDTSYRDLDGWLDRAELDLRLDRLKDAGYLEFHFTDRRIELTGAGNQAFERAFRGGWKHGQLPRARELYGRFPPPPRQPATGR